MFLEKRESRITGIANKNHFKRKHESTTFPTENCMPGFWWLLTTYCICHGYCWFEDM